MFILLGGCFVGEFFCIGCGQKPCTGNCEFSATPPAPRSFEPTITRLMDDGSLKTYIEKRALDAALAMRDEYLSRLQEKCDDVLALIEEKKAALAEIERLKQEVERLKNGV